VDRDLVRSVWLKLLRVWDELCTRFGFAEDVCDTEFVEYEISKVEEIRKLRTREQPPKL